MRGNITYCYYFPKPASLTKSWQFLFNSTLSDYMIYTFQARYSGMDCRNPGTMDDDMDSSHTLVL